MNIICKVFGHRHERWPEGCGRSGCAADGYASVVEEGLARTLSSDLVRLIWSDCCDCGKPTRRLGFPIGQHSDCIPF